MTAVERVRVYQDTAGEWRWSALAANNEIVGEGESYTRREDAVRAVSDVFGDRVPIVEDEADD